MNKRINLVSRGRMQNFSHVSYHAGIKLRNTKFYESCNSKPCCSMNSHAINSKKDKVAEIKLKGSDCKFSTNGGDVLKKKGN